MTKKELTFVPEKETKRTVRFMEEATDPVIGYVYIQKTALEGAVPKSIKVTLEW